MLVIVVWHLTGRWPAFLPLRDSTMHGLEWAMAGLRWSLALFFMMAGFFGARLAGQWGAKRFALDRLRRIGLPLVVGVVAIVPLSAVILHWVRPGLKAVPAPAHLWFLWYVLVLYAIGLLALRAPGRERLTAAVGRLMDSPLVVPLLAAVSTAGLVLGRAIGVNGDTWLVPLPGLLLFYGSYFAVGLLLSGSRRGIEAVGARMPLTGALAAASLVPLVLIDPKSVWDGPGGLIGEPHSVLWLGLYSLFSWSALLFVCGLGRRFLATERPAVRYAADSSYWVYLMHFPLVPLAILAVAPLGLPFPVAWLAALALLFAVLLMTYELFVRHTVIGRTLNGRRPPRRWPRRLRRERVPAAASG